jgi:hypothetical protein
MMINKLTYAIAKDKTEVKDLFIAIEGLNKGDLDVIEGIVDRYVKRGFVRKERKAEIKSGNGFEERDTLETRYAGFWFSGLRYGVLAEEESGDLYKLNIGIHLPKSEGVKIVAEIKARLNPEMSDKAQASYEHLQGYIERRR